jgi:hypothetical protein
VGANCVDEGSKRRRVNSLVMVQYVTENYLEVKQSLNVYVVETALIPQTTYAVLFQGRCLLKTSLTMV